MAGMVDSDQVMEATTAVTVDTEVLTTRNKSHYFQISHCHPVNITTTSS